MYGRHSRPSQTGKLAGQATRITPAIAVAGAMLGMPHHAEPPPPSHAVAASALDFRGHHTSSARPPSAQIYVVQANDTLWSIAQRFYGNPLMWSHIYYANQSQIRDPNLIYQGQKLTIPQAGTARATTDTTSATKSSTSAAPRQASSLSSVTGYIHQTAQGTGLPESVVAAQVQVESNYESSTISSAGAEGPYRFMPSTWATLGFPAGQEFDWATSTHAYINFMRQLLAWSGGNVRLALAAYNAGQANWQAGLGYADQILSLAEKG